MTIQKAHLRKLLQFFALPENKLTTGLRGDIREEIRKQSGEDDGGGDFHSPFWSDAKRHVAGQLALTNQTEVRIDGNYSRRRLYPLLCDGFLEWWDNKRRWSNESFDFLETSVKGRFDVTSVDAVVKVENLLALRIGSTTNRLIYPYFSETPPISDDIARLGLWAMGEALPEYSIDDMRILDVLRSNSFSTREHPLRGNEREFFEANYDRIMKLRHKLKNEYA